jgi:hypothetical protein
MNGAGTKEVKYVSNFIPSLSNAPKVIIVRRLTRLMTGLKGNGRLIRKKRRAKMQTKKAIVVIVFRAYLDFMSV